MSIRHVTNSYDLKPDGDDYAPQTILTSSSNGHLEDITELNTEALPFTAERFREYVEEFSNKFRYTNESRYGFDGVVLTRFMKIFYGIDMLYTGTTGHAQSDWGVSYVFGTPEFYKLTGATRITKADHHDLCAWIWGEVYEIYTPATYKDETCSLGHVHQTLVTPETSDQIVYGFDEARKLDR